MKLRRVIFLILILILCLPSMAQQTADPLACPPDFAAYLSPRLSVGEWARVLETPLNFRPTPGTQQARLEQLAPGTYVEISAGPLCNEGYVWWGTERAGVRGWLAEGSADGAIYWLEPRGRLLAETGADGLRRLYALHEDGFIEPADCAAPPEDYTRQLLQGFATFNQRTLFMLDVAQRAYEGLRPDGIVNFRQLITQGSYNAGGVAASFGTHDAGGAVDISVRSPLDWSVMSEEMPYMIEALRVAGFAAWVRETGLFYVDSPVHIHAIAVGDAELSPIARAQIDGERGYLRAYDGLPSDYAPQPRPDAHGGPVICQWMWAAGWRDLREVVNGRSFTQHGADLLAAGRPVQAVMALNVATERDPLEGEARLLRADAFYALGLSALALADYAAYIEATGENKNIQQRMAELQALLDVES